VSPTTPKPPTTPPAAPEPPPRPAPGPLRNGNPRGNPNLAPRCGAKARTTGCPCRAPAMPNGRCRMHAGNCRGPSTPEGRQRMTAANTKHGNFSAYARAEKHHVRTTTARNRLVCTATLLWPYLPPDMAARLAQGPVELFAPVHHSNLPYLTPQDAMPSKVKIRRGKPTPKPTGRAASTTPAPLEGEGRNEGSRRNAIQRENAPSPADQPTAATPAPRLTSWRDLTLLQRELAARLARLRGPRCAQPPSNATPSPQAKPKSPGRNAVQRELTARPAGRQTETAGRHAVQRGSPTQPPLTRSAPLATAALPAPLNRAARRRLKYLQHRRDRAARPRP
jgi:hypothetical protein